jgi:hypothetical protein
VIVYDPKVDADYRVLYDARLQQGARVVVREIDGVEKIKEDLPVGEKDPRKVIIKAARERALELAESLEGLVFVGYDPRLLAEGSLKEYFDKCLTIK